MEAGAFRRELARNPELRSCIDSYIYVQLTQTMLAEAAARAPGKASQ